MLRGGGIVCNDTTFMLIIPLKFRKTFNICFSALTDLVSKSSPVVKLSDFLDTKITISKRK